MNRQTLGIILLIAGVLVFLWANSQISNTPPDFLLPSELIQRKNVTIAAYRLVQVVAAVAAIGGGILVFGQERKK